MPHLDVCSFIVQYNWTVITFLTLYVIVSTKYLPKIGEILHTRIRKIMNKGEDVSLDIKKSTPSLTIFKNSLNI